MAVEFKPGVLAGSVRAVLDKALSIFRQRRNAAELPGEQRTEERWARQYGDANRVNFAEIFALRLTNYAAAESAVECSDELVDEVLRAMWAKLYKWLPLGIAIGRVYLLPHIAGDRVCVSFVPQSQVIDTDTDGDRVVGFVCVADRKVQNGREYSRIEHYYFDRSTRSYTITNKATESMSGGEVALDVVPAWASIPPVVVFAGVDAPLFGYVDSPRDNRRADKPAGAGILFGCDDTVREIYDCFGQYEREYSNKVSVLGLNQSLVSVGQNPLTGAGGYSDTSAIPQRYVKYDAIGKLGADQSDLFSVFSPDIRAEAYRVRLLDLFSRLERQVGTSAGILTPVETGQATATQVRRTMYDTHCMVDRIRASVETALKNVAQAISAMYAAIGQATTEPDVSVTWGDGMEQSKDEHFQQMAQAHSAGVISDAEFRQEVYPGESIEEAEAAVAAIQASRPEPLGAMFPPDGDE